MEIKESCTDAYKSYVFGASSVYTPMKTRGGELQFTLHKQTLGEHLPSAPSPPRRKGITNE